MQSLSRILVARHLQPSLTALNTHDGGEPDEVQGGCASNKTSSSPLALSMFPSYCEISQARTYFTFSIPAVLFVSFNSYNSCNMAAMRIFGRQSKKE